MFLGRFSTWIFRWAKPRSCRCPGALPRTRRILDTRFLNFRYSFHTSMDFSLTAERQPFLRLILEQYTQGPFQLVEGQVTMTYEIFTPEGPLALMLHQFMLSFCLMQQTVNIFKPQWYPTTATQNPVYHISNTTTFSNRDITVHYYYPWAPEVHITMWGFYCMTLHKCYTSPGLLISEACSQLYMWKYIMKK